MSSRARLLVVPLSAAALAVAACGGGDDSGKIKDLVNRVAKDNAYACDHATDRLLKELNTTPQACKQALAGAKPSPVKGDISVKVDGDKATADFTASDGKKRHVSFVKQGGDWKIDQIATP